MRFTTAVLAAVGVLASTCGHAFAEELEATKTPVTAPVLKTPTLTPSEEPAREWYGGQTLLVGGGSLVLGTVGSLALSSAIPSIVGLGGMVLGPPIIHWTHGNVGKGFISLGLMTVLPMAAGFVGGAVDSWQNPDSEMSGLFGLYVGVFVGLPLAVLLDSMILAWDVPERNVPPTPKAQSRRFEIAPTFALTQQGGGVGVVGRF